jgi:hypothetical protein
MKSNETAKVTSQRINDIEKWHKMGFVLHSRTLGYSELCKV